MEKSGTKMPPPPSTFSPLPIFFNGGGGKQENLIAHCNFFFIFSRHTWKNRILLYNCLWEKNLIASFFMLSYALRERERERESSERKRPWALSWMGAYFCNSLLLQHYPTIHDLFWASTKFQTGTCMQHACFVMLIVFMDLHNGLGDHLQQEGASYWT